MTVTYIQHIPESGFGFLRVFPIWRGSIYKGIWKSLLLYCLLFASISLVYRNVLSGHEEVKQAFERWCVYVNRYEGILPLNFILGFYVSQVGDKKERFVCPLPSTNKH